MIVWVIFGSGGGSGPALGRRITEILRQMKINGEIPPATIIGLMPLASIYEIDTEKKSRAQAINLTLFRSLAFRMNSHSYPVYYRNGEIIHTQYLNGLFDFLMIFGSGQDWEILFYDEIIDRAVEITWQIGFGGAGPDFLATIANEARESQSNQRRNNREKL
jgi:hypothetical protein